MSGLWKWIGRLGTGLAALLFVSATTGYLYERGVDAEAVRRNSRIGQLVDVGGYRLHLDCQGTGQPALATKFKPTSRPS
jgi:hypothetical protein